MEPRGYEGSVVVFHVHLRKDTRGQLQGSIWIMGREECKDQNKYKRKIIVKSAL